MIDTFRTFPIHRRLRSIHCEQNVLDQPCLVTCTLHTTIDAGTAQQTDEIAIEEVITKDTGQTILPNMLTFEQLKKLLSDIQSSIKPL